MGGNHFVYNSPSAVINWGSGNSGVLYFRHLSTQGDISSFNEAMTLTWNTTIGSGTRLGIGTTSPSQKLEIYHSDVTGGILLNRASGTSKKSEIKFSSAGTECYAIGNDIDGNGHQTFFIWDQVNNKSPFLINEEGRVSIGGTIVPTGGGSDYQLYVYGGITARDVLVTSSTFPDYVFDTNYRLMSIPDLEHYITTNKHLPGMPSEEEVKDNNGFEVGNIQVKLLKIVEEQTLYIIELQNQINNLRKELSNIKTN